jgi:hypothetical protein
MGGQSGTLRGNAWHCGRLGFRGGDGRWNGGEHGVVRGEDRCGRLGACFRLRPWLDGGGSGVECRMSRSHSPRRICSRLPARASSGIHMTSGPSVLACAHSLADSQEAGVVLSEDKEIEDSAGDDLFGRVLGDLVPVQVTVQRIRQTRHNRNWQRIRLHRVSAQPIEPAIATPRGRGVVHSETWNN